MKSSKKFFSNKQSRLFRSLVATAFIANGFFPIAAAFAEGTTAGTTISNTATATYEDPLAPNSPINSTSNTVTVVIAEVAGITVTGSGIANITNPGGVIAPGNLLSYTFTVTNVGNSGTKFQIPNVSTTTGPVTVSGTLTGSTISGQLQYSTDGGTTWANVPTSGLTTASIPVNGSVLVRVPVTVQNSAVAGDTITARLGQTPGDAQNQARIADGGDVFTVDADPTIAPINGVREASATQDTKVGDAPKIKALATLLKTRTAYNPRTTSALDDDLLTYGLNLRVEDNDVTNSGQIPAPLIGSPIQLKDGAAAVSSVNRILVSDAIPANTVLNSTPTAPAGWQVVYSIDDPTTTNANAATTTWTTTAPTLSTVKRVGFINIPGIIDSVSPGVTVTGFSIQVVTSGVTGTPTTTIIDNIAQVFGQTSGDATNALVYDESGDQTPSNYNSNGSTFNNTPDNGFNTQGTSGYDPANNNTGTANDGTGEYNTLTISVPNAISLVNGPNNAPDAVGPTNNNDDFTNKSALIDSNVAPGTTNFNPAPVAFTNTVKNTGGTAANISLLPTKPSVQADLPNDTLVTISYKGLSATYKYDRAAGTFGFVTGSGVGLVGSSAVSATNPVRIDNVGINATDSYGVSVDLPVNTPLSTDTSLQGGSITTIERGFPAPVTAFIDDLSVVTNVAGSIDAGEATNITIDRVYTGFLQLVKQSRLLKGTGPAIIAGEDQFSITQKNPQPGNIIEYRITYKNISSPVVGTGNVILSADKVVITENGTLSTTPGDGKNNWAKDNDNNQDIDTSNVVGTASDSGASTITFFNGATGSTPGSDVTGLTVITDVTKYVNSVTGQVTPGVIRTFTFQRKVN